MFRSLGKSIRYLILAALLLLVSLCAIEVGLRIRLAMMPAGEDEWPGDTSHPWVVPSATTFVEMQPAASFRVKHPDTGQELLLRTNSYGLRGAEIQIPKPPGVLRILCLGDETTLAAGVDERATYAAQLQANLATQTSQNVEVINAGMNQGCPLLALIHLKQRLLALQPDLIILHFDMTDVRDDHQLRPWVGFDASSGASHATHPLLRRRERQNWQCWEDQFLVAQWGTDTLWSHWSSGDGRRSRADINSRTGGEAWLRDDPPNWEPYIRNTLTPITEMKSIADALGCRFMLSTTPRPWQVSPQASATTEARQPYGVGLSDHYRSRRPFEVLSAFAAEQYIPFLDTSPSFTQYAAPEDLYLRKSPELSELGHQLYAYELAGAVMQLIPDIWSQAGASTEWQ